MPELECSEIRELAFGMHVLASFICDVLIVINVLATEISASGSEG